jgi:hypothetical protein
MLTIAIELQASMQDKAYRKYSMKQGTDKINDKQLLMHNITIVT